MKIILSLIATVILSVSGYAGNDNGSKNKEAGNVTTNTEVKAATIQLTGNVMDTKSNETLAGATVYIDGEKAYSDLDGNFTFTDIKPGKHKISVELISYEKSEQEIDINQNSKINIHLVQK